MSTTHENETTLTGRQPVAASELEIVLEAWQDATVRLEQTHAALRDEVRRLSDELEIKNRELARKNRLADLGQIASHIAHEVRNNLVPVSLYLSLLRRRLSDDLGSLDVLEKVAGGVSALDCTVNDLLHFTADRDPHWTHVNVRMLVNEVCASLAPQFEAQSIAVVANVPERVTISADRDMFRRAVLNIALNALDAMPEGGELVFTACWCRDEFELEIADSGPGLNEETARRAFEPFYSTKSTGTGLGLAIVERIAEAHGGWAQVANCPEGGAAFTIRIPQRALEAAA
ncbi:MAG TPA: ATP-binding protein [Pirellulales bacterium]|jgi:signal transduction histidine kinase|nr:ATP-binding protein [Pirellulales bacterium]